MKRRARPATSARKRRHARHAWEHALRRFLEPWRRRKDVVGALVCGSYVTGSPSPRSDVDVAIVLARGTRFRERGNRVVDGVLFEYFANPPAQFRAYFRDGLRLATPHTSTMFVTGRVVFDARGEVAALRRDARRVRARAFATMPARERDFEKYALWDGLDNLLDALESRSPAAAHVYHHHLQDVYEGYARFLRAERWKPRRLHGALTRASVRAKYRAEAFPDAPFARLLAQALCEQRPERMRTLAERLTAHVLSALGGFEIDGFRARDALKLGGTRGLRSSGL